MNRIVIQNSDCTSLQILQTITDNTKSILIDL